MVATIVPIIGDAIAAGVRPLNVEDILRMEDVGVVEIDPTGERIVFERIPQYSKRSTFGIDEARLVGDLYEHRINSHAPPRCLVISDGVEGRWIGAFSPAGSRLALYWLADGVTKAGAFDFAQSAVIEFPIAPYFDFAQARPVWLSEDELIFPTLPWDEISVRTTYRRDAARRLARAWEQAWRGEQTTADVVTSTPDSVSTMREGALVRVNASTGVARMITRGLFLALNLSPSKRYLAAVQRGGLRPLGSGHMAVGGQGPYRFEVVILDLARAGEPVYVCSGCDVVLSSLEWSRSTEALTFFARTADQDWSQATYHIFDARLGVRSAIPHIGLDLVSERERRRDAVPEQAVPFDAGLAVPARPQANTKGRPMFSDRPAGDAGQGRIDWYLVTRDGGTRNLTGALKSVSAVLVAVSRDALFVLADGDVWRIAARGSPVNLTATIPDKLTFARAQDPEGFEARDLGATSVVMQTEAANKKVAFLDLMHGVATVVPLPRQTGRLIANAANAGATVFRHNGNGGSQLTVLLRDGRTDHFWTVNAHLADVEPARQVSVTYELANLQEATSCVLMPRTWVPGMRLPVLVHVYPRSFSRCVVNYLNGVVDPYEPELFASMGYAVLFPFAPERMLRNTRGPLGNWSKMVLPAVNAVVEAGYGDPDRLGAFGYSYGSISVLALLTQTERFRAAIATNGAANFTSHYGSLGIVRRVWPNDLFAAGQAISYESRGSYLWLGTTPWENPETYVQASPFFDVLKVQTPLMLMHSDLDWNYQMEQFDQVFTALFRLGKDAQYVRYWGEGHGVSSPANVRDMWARMESWYARWLKGD